MMEQTVNQEGYTMVTMAQRIEALRTERGLSRPGLSAVLGFPKNAAEKFETGRQTPTKEQQEQLAGYFGVSLFYLRGESSDPTRQDDWMEGAYTGPEPDAAPAPARPPKQAKTADAPQGAMLDALLMSKQAQQLLRAVVLDTLRSPEGQALIAKAVKGLK